MCACMGIRGKDKGWGGEYMGHKDPLRLAPAGALWYTRDLNTPSYNTHIQYIHSFIHSFIYGSLWLNEQDTNNVKVLSLIYIGILFPKM